MICCVLTHIILCDQVGPVGKAFATETGGPGFESHSRLKFWFPAIFFLRRNMLHCNVLGVAQILLVDGCLLTS